ncbi:MAG: heavy metal transporter [Cyclobacteriaceae bacterium]
MAKIIRASYRRDLSFGILVIIFAVVFFLAEQLFEKHLFHQEGWFSLNLARALAGMAVILMILIMWEEILFNVHVKPVDDHGFIFRNHGTKLKSQALIYLIIPVIIVFLYFNYRVSAFRFFGWAAVVGILPIIGKLKSGIRNYNDYLKLTVKMIEYKNNDLHGTFALSEVKQIVLIKDRDKVLHKVRLMLAAGPTVTIDIDEMELHDFYEVIEEYITLYYAPLLAEGSAKA